MCISRLPAGSAHGLGRTSVVRVGAAVAPVYISRLPAGSAHGLGRTSVCSSPVPGPTILALLLPPRVPANRVAPDQASAIFRTPS